VITELEEGQTPGDQIVGTGYTIFKARVQNSDIRKGKRSGYRLIYYLATAESVVLLTIYSKSDQGDISAKKLREIVSEFEEASD
jgi:mRNA-degrading endonuclease RelE of RelBE toxin-antitoxin system